MAPLPRNAATRSAFAFFRKAWGPRAAYTLTRARYGSDPAARFAAVLWLIRERVPATGAAASLPFPGLPFRPASFAIPVTSGPRPVQSKG